MYPFKKVYSSSCVATVWRVLSLRLEERPPDVKGSWEYIE